ncbi:MAG: spore cortex biosynthesis protein YabQ [Clostridia bacterium]|nr:spore cortex biosynthesis protein YabQ [Clostridia bacterium]
MDSQNQISVFALCVCVGFVGGLLYEIFWLLGAPFCRKGKRKWLRATLDIAFWLSFAVFSVFCAYFLKFPSFRVYMWIGYLLGGILYSKSLRRIVAFFEKICYNKLTKIRKRQENKEENLKKVEK